jgi:hypothetical protein
MLARAWGGPAVVEDGDDGTSHGPCGAGRRRPGTGMTASIVGCAGRTGSGRRWGRWHQARGRLKAKRHEGRRWSGLAGDGDDRAEGKPARAWATALGADTASRNKKMKLSQSKLCGMRGERSSALL